MTSTADKEHGPLKILVVGAGIGGLTAAVGLRQEGHDIVLFERSELVQEVGAAIHLAPNCHGLLKRFGIFPEEFGANQLCGITSYDGKGKVIKDTNLKNVLQMWQHPWVLCHRVSLHNDIKRAATSPSGIGKPAVLKTGSRVVSVDPDTATVTLEDGTTYSGDLVLGADGVSSITRKCIVGDSIKPFGSGKSAFRFLIPRETVSGNSKIAYLAQQEGYMRLWYGTDRRFVMYPCSNNTMLNFVAIHPSELSPSKQSGGKQDRRIHAINPVLMLTIQGGAKREAKTSLLKLFSDFGPEVEELLSLVDPKELKLWTLLDMVQMPAWVKGKMALLGDAAHPFLPHQGQGGGIAIEDAASLCALLRAGTTKSEIPDRLALYEKIRMERAHTVQHFTRVSGEDIVEGSGKEFNVIEFNNYNFNHDEWHNTSHELQKWLWSRNGPTYWRQPTAFGPMTSPRRDHCGKVVPSADGRFRTYNITFTSSTTYLQTFFPTTAFRFSHPGTKAKASFRLTEVSNLDWLGGGGYRFFGLWIHGVKYTKKDGSSLNGSYLPLLFENLTDPIITGREELGMPKLYCDIDVHKKVGDNGDTDLVCSWRGAEFVRLSLRGLHAEKESERTTATTSLSSIHGNDQPRPSGVVIPQQPRDDGLLIYRYVPSVGRLGVPDAEYAVFVPKEGASTPRVVESKQVAQTAVIEALAGNMKELPTLHHISTALADIPVYSVDDASVEEGHGVEDLSQAYRIK